VKRMSFRFATGAIQSPLDSRDYIYSQMIEVPTLPSSFQLPLMTYTDPCLFNWSKDNFEAFEFRYNK